MDLSGQRVLVIAAHPDDEVFGCGGFLHRIKRAGGSVHVLFMTVGNTQDFSGRGYSRGDERLAELQDVAGFLGYDGYALGFPGDDDHLRLDARPQRDLIHRIERGGDCSIEAIRPTILLTTARDDYNQDHRAVFAATVTATRPAPHADKHFVPLVAAYELPYAEWSTDAARERSAWHVALAPEDLDAKVEALRRYRSQIKNAAAPLSPHGIRALAAFRGVQVGCQYAESYQLLRSVV